MNLLTRSPKIPFDPPRLDVAITSHEKIFKEIKKISSIFDRKVILQDLLNLGGRGETLEEKIFISFSAEIFMHVDIKNQREFLFELEDNQKILYELFKKAVISNALFHSRHGSHHHTNKELLLERHYAVAFATGEF